MDGTFENRYGVLAGRTATHIYLLPSPALRPYVAHYTICPGTAGGPGGGGLLTLVPDASGCLVFTDGGDGLESRVYGPTTAAVTVENDLSAGPLRFFVEFRPGGEYAFLPVPQWELADRVLPLADLHPGLARAMSRLWRACPDLDEFVRGADAALAGICRDTLDFSRLLSHLAASRAPSPAAALVAYTGYSQRHLSRLLREGAGLSAKAFARVLRVNAAARSLREGAPSLTRLAQELGYYDQSHFIHDFRAVCGVSPSRYRAGLSDFYNEPLKF